MGGTCSAFGVVHPILPFREDVDVQRLPQQARVAGSRAPSFFLEDFGVVQGIHLQYIYILIFVVLYCYFVIYLYLINYAYCY